MKFYVLNTNKRQHKQCEEDMIKHQTASAYGIPWGNSIKKLEVGDIVFLYSNKVGIIAYGIVETDWAMRSFCIDNIKDDEYYVRLRNFKLLKTPMPASRIKEITSKLSFRQTMFSIDC